MRSSRSQIWTQTAQPAGGVSPKIMFSSCSRPLCVLFSSFFSSFSSYLRCWFSQPLASESKAFKHLLSWQWSRDLVLIADSFTSVEPIDNWTKSRSSRVTKDGQCEYSHAICPSLMISVEQTILGFLFQVEFCSLANTNMTITVLTANATVAATETTSSSPSQPYLNNGKCRKCRIRRMINTVKHDQTQKHLKSFKGLRKRRSFL